MAIRRRAQMKLAEKVIEDPELERLLEDRELLAEAHAHYRDKTKAAQSRVKDLGSEGTFRCGRFVVSVSAKEGRHVEFEQGSRIQIGFKVAKGSD